MTVKRMNIKILKSIYKTFLVAFVLSINATAQEFPDKPVPPRLVNDFAGLLEQQEIDALEQKLVAYNDSTSTQIAIVSVTNLHGYESGDYAQRLAEKWGIGQKDLNNGILILIKPKTSESSRGEVFIAQGYGLEGIIPDIVCGQIIDREILPEFRAGNYYRGLDKATNVLMSLASREFPADKYEKSKSKNIKDLTPFIFIIIFIIIMMFVRSSGGTNQKHISKKGLPLWMLLALMNSGRNSHKGSWGGFTGGGFGGGGGGGFGGFGGGSFGGGGAGGSW